MAFIFPAAESPLEKLTILHVLLLCQINDYSYWYMALFDRESEGGSSCDCAWEWKHLQVFTAKTCFSSPREDCDSYWTNSYHREDRMCHEINRKKDTIQCSEEYRPLRQSSETPLHCIDLITPLPSANRWPNVCSGTIAAFSILSPRQWTHQSKGWVAAVSLFLAVATFTFS